VSLSLFFLGNSKVKSKVIKEQIYLQFRPAFWSQANRLGGPQNSIIFAL
jgi:hypothetical protein